MLSKFEAVYVKLDEMDKRLSTRIDEIDKRLSTRKCLSRSLTLTGGFSQSFGYHITLGIKELDT